MDMAAADPDVAERPPAGADPAGREAGDDKGSREPTEQVEEDYLVPAGGLIALDRDPAGGLGRAAG
jgi:hypothetical protein